MRKILITIALAMFLSINPVSAEAHCKMMGGGPAAYDISLILQNADKLALNDKQREAIADIQTRYMRDIIRQEAEAKIAQMELDSLIKKDDIDLSKVKDAIKKHGDIDAQISYLHIEAFVEAGKVLTDEQKGKLKELMMKPPAMMTGEMGQMMEKMMSGQAKAAGPMAQEKMAGEVAVIAELKNPGDIGGKGDLIFNVKLNTHTVNLDAFNFKDSIILKNDKGKIFKPVSAQPSGSGHHREADIRFKNPGKVKFVELAVKNLAGVKETVFKWEFSEGMKMGE